MGKLLYLKRWLANKKSSTESIVWKGDLTDDCTAEWAGLMLRAEQMGDNNWWWAVYDMQQNDVTIDCSNEYGIFFTNGNTARSKAESVAKAYWIHKNK